MVGRPPLGGRRGRGRPPLGARGRGRPPLSGRGRGRPPLRSRGGRGRPPLSGRGRGRPPLRGRGRGPYTQEIHITVHSEDIVSAIERFALQNGHSFVYVSRVTGILSEYRVEGMGITAAGEYEIVSCRGSWSEFGLSGDDFYLNIHLRDLADGSPIHGNSKFLLAKNNVEVYMEI